MTTKRTYGDVVWIDLLKPTNEEVREIVETYRINPNIAKNMLLPSPKPQIYDYRDLMYLVMHFPTIQKRGLSVGTEEVDFLLGKKFIITIHYQPVDALDQFAKYFEVSSIIKNEDVPHAGFIFFELLKELYKTVKDRVESIEDEISAIESKVFHGKEKEVVKELSILNHTLLAFKQMIDPQKEFLDLACAYTGNMFGDDFRHISKAIAAEHAGVSKEIQYKKETLEELWNTNDTLLSSKQNEIMKTLTMVSFVIFPLSLIVSIFDLYTNLRSVESGTRSFLFLMLILVLGILGTVLYFKNKKWL